MNKFRIPPPAALQWKTRPQGRVFRVWREGVRWRSSWTSKTCPCGCVFDVRREGYGRGPAGHEEHISGMVFCVQREGVWQRSSWTLKHAHVGMFLMFGVRAMVRDPLDTKTRPWGCVFMFGVKGDGWWTGEGHVGWQEMGWGGGWLTT